MNKLISIGMQDTCTIKFEKHFHKLWEVTYYYDGEGTNITDGKSYDFSPGVIICQPPLLEHEDISENGYKNIYFLVDNFTFQYSKPLIFKDTTNKDFLYCLRQLYSEYHKRGKDHQRVTDALLNVLYQYMLDFIDHKQVDIYVEGFVQTIIDNLSNCNFVILDEMKKLPICPNHFRRIFKNCIGFSPKQYMQNLRISYSKQLLKNSSLPLKNICAMCGFEDPYYFSRLFKKQVGMSPIIWKQLDSTHI